MTLPAWKAHKDFIWTMDMLNIIGADAIANEQVNQVLNMGNLWWAEMEKRTHPHLDLEVWSDLAWKNIHSQSQLIQLHNNCYFIDILLNF